MNLKNIVKTCVSLSLFGALFPAFASVAVEQRQAFKNAYEKARSGDATILRETQSTLSDYILWPDLVSANYLGRLSKIADRDIEQQLDRNPDTSINRTLRYRYATRLAKRGDTERFLKLYDAHYTESDDTIMDCYAAHARLHGDDNTTHRSAALDLWLVGKSQPKECDPLFHRLQKDDLLTAKRYTERLHLALAANELKLATYLAKKAPAAERVWLSRWQTMRRDPATALKRIKRVPSHDLRDALYIYGVRRAARRDPANTYALLRDTAEDAQIDHHQYQALLNYIALRGARDGLPEVDTWTAGLQSTDDDVARWQVRSALGSGDWTRVLKSIDAMRPTLAKESAWRYFRARAMAELGDHDGSQALLRDVAEERSYYGFMAADRLDAKYQFSHKTIADDPELAAKLMQLPAFVRARELFFVNLYGPARSEWERAVRGLELPLRQQASLLADRWGWHSQAIRTLAYSGGQNDLLRSYPTPFKADFDEHASRADIARTWAYGVTRSESLFMSDVKSSAGAIGLMQLIPGTGKETARRARVPYRGLQTLLDPQRNIQLGVHYLGQMYNRFDKNQVLATAAYNAGPRRVKSWLPERGNVPADIWVETIPFNETRKYVQKVLFADTVFHWRLTGDERRLASRMPPIHKPTP
ncbi:MAG: transglycosylase SLT domain-containing protein [Gammaproteobacteria bacterium]